MSVELNSAPTPRMNGRQGIALVVIMLVIGGGAYFIGRSSNSAAPTNNAPETSEKKTMAEHDQEEAGHEEHGEVHAIKFDAGALKIANLRVEAVSETALPVRLNVTGVVEPNLSGVAKVTSRVGGKITALYVNVGDTVRVGQPMALVSSAELATAQATYRQASARISNALDVLKRQRKLASLGEFGRHKVEEARTRTVQTQGDRNTAEKDVVAAQAEVIEAESRLRAVQAAVTQAQNQVEVMQSRFERSDALFKEELLSKQDWEQARADMKKAQSDLEAERANQAQAHAAIESAKARVKSAQSKLTTAERNLEIAQQQQQREETIFRGGYFTSQEIVQAETALRQAQLDEKAASENVRLLGGAPGGGNLLTINAPLRGRVTERTVTLGETIGSDKSLFALLNADSVWVQLSVFQSDLGGVRVGQPVIIAASAAPDKTFQGVISYIGETADERTRTVKVRAVIQNAGGLLKPGVFVTGDIVGGRRGQRRGIAIPQESVQELEGKQVVFVAEESEGEFKAQPVEAGNAIGNRIEIRSGIKAGDRIVTQNAFTVKSQAMKAELGEGHAH